MYNFPSKSGILGLKALGKPDSDLMLDSNRAGRMVEPPFRAKGLRRLLVWFFGGSPIFDGVGGNPKGNQ